MERLKKYWILFVIGFFLLAIIKPALCFLIFGLFILYLSIASIRLQKRLSVLGVECVGRILSFETDSDGDKTPVVEFTPTGGTVITEKPFIYSSTDLSKLRSYDNLIGKEVLVTYDPEDPKRFVLTQEKGLNIFVFAVFLLGGGVFVGVGIAGLAGFIRLGH